MNVSLIYNKLVSCQGLWRMLWLQWVWEESCGCKLWGQSCRSTKVRRSSGQQHYLAACTDTSRLRRGAAMAWRSTTLQGTQGFSTITSLYSRIASRTLDYWCTKQSRKSEDLPGTTDKRWLLSTHNLTQKNHNTNCFQFIKMFYHIQIVRYRHRLKKTFIHLLKFNLVELLFTKAKPQWCLIG